ncbi:MAG: hypothetical protein ACNA7V_12170 [Bacteroidales bacterium]
MDFTVYKYQQLLEALKNQGYSFQTFAEFLDKPEEKVIILRHDVDAKKLNSLRFAKIQHEAGVKGTYYFRMVPQSFDEKVILDIAAMGHEIGYHYEEMDLAASKLSVRGSALTEEELMDEAIKIFDSNLDHFRKLYPVKTICMHGSPRSPHDNKAIWKKYKYRDRGIIGEPYFDIDFSDVCYLTDTGRRWDGESMSIRDKVNIGTSDKMNPNRQDISQQPKAAGQSRFPVFHTTSQIIRAAENGHLPDRIMFTFHPQRWTNNPVHWLWELVFQNLKNQVKRYIVQKKNR